MVCKIFIEFKNGKSETISTNRDIDSIKSYLRPLIGTKFSASFIDLEGSEIIINVLEVQFIRITKLG